MTIEERITALEERLAHIESRLEPEMIRCPSCHGRGTWETECCNGSWGCSCRGEPVDMGTCNVCHGEGRIRADHQGVNLSANLDTIRGQCFIGSGPKTGYWAGR